ncbi:hypothetical protein H0H93_007390 [Arthromyces matolae]|nr:hypothetical protein H0H93_007390 [Arthromyces matolae]
MKSRGLPLTVFFCVTAAILPACAGNPVLPDDHFNDKGDFGGEHWSWPHDHSNKPHIKTCIVKHNRNGKDDSDNILAAFKECQTNSIIEFQQVEYNAFTPITLGGLNNVQVRFNGNLNLPQDIGAVQSAINITKNQPSTYATPWFYIDGTDVSIIGSNHFQWGRFNGHGQHWWDLGNRTLRPQLATFNVTNGFLKNLKVIKPVAWGWNLPGRNIHVENHYVDAAPTNGTRDTTTSFPFNTDGFNLSGQNITIDGYYGHNGDDCISVINGAKDIVAKNGYCGFSSHGLSIGSLGKGGAYQTVQNVLFKNWTMDGAVYGARATSYHPFGQFKSWTGGSGFADNVTWEDITLVGVSTGIFITQNYYDQDKGPRPANPNNSSTLVSNFHYKNFKGTLGTNWTDGTCISNPCWNYVAGLDEPKAIIFDLYPNTAVNITVSDIHIKAHSGSNTNVLCDPTTLEPGEQDTLGFQARKLLTSHLKMTSPPPAFVTAQLTFFVQPPNGVRAFQHINHVNTGDGEGDRPRNFEREQRDVVVENLRGHEDEYKLDNAGFQLIKEVARHTSFVNDAEIKQEYYPESAELIKKITGASRVVFFDHTIRRHRPGEVDDGPDRRQPVSQAHVDQTKASSIARVHRHLPPEDVDALLSRRFQIINLWRPIKHAAIDWPLALCDWKSVDPKNDTLPVALVYPNREPGETYGIKYNPAQRWKYFYGMSPEEAVLIKCFDSIQDGTVAVFTPHTGFKDPTTPAGTPLRESIELRALVFY